MNKPKKFKSIKIKNIHIEYDSLASMLYIYLKPKGTPVHSTSSLANSPCIVDRDETGNVIGLEIYLNVPSESLIKE
jgi:uncharacterized protein YuzE